MPVETEQELRKCLVELTKAFTLQEEAFDYLWEKLRGRPEEWDDVAIEEEVGKYARYFAATKPNTKSHAPVFSEAISQAVTQATVQAQPRLPILMHHKGSGEVKHLQPFLNRFREEFWGGNWLDEAGYAHFMESPAVCLFSHADFEQWGIPLASHGSQLRLYQPWVTEPPSPAETGILPEGKPIVIDGESYQTRFRMRLEVWEHLVQSPLPVNKHGVATDGFDAIFRWMDAAKGPTLHVETVKDRCDARCVERTPSPTALDGFPLIDPVQWRFRAPYPGALLTTEYFPNQSKGRMERWVQWAYPGSCLMEFAMDARKLALEMEWTEAAACRALATGELLETMPIVPSLRYLPAEGQAGGGSPRAVDRVELSIDPDVSPQAVREAYRAARECVGVGRQYHTDTGIRAVAHVEVEKKRMGIAGEPTLKQWKEMNRTFDWQGNGSNETGDFKQAYNRGLKKSRSGKPEE